MKVYSNMQMSLMKNQFLSSYLHHETRTPYHETRTLYHDHENLLKPYQYRYQIEALVALSNKKMLSV